MRRAGQPLEADSVPENRLRIYSALEDLAVMIVTAAQIVTSSQSTIEVVIVIVACWQTMRIRTKAPGCPHFTVTLSHCGVCCECDAADVEP